jgi:hypothetical protein
MTAPTNRTRNIQVNYGVVSSAAHTTGNPVTTNDLYFGSLEGFNDLWNGDIDEVKIWRRVLTGRNGRAITQRRGGRRR